MEHLLSPKHYAIVWSYKQIMTVNMSDFKDTKSLLRFQSGNNWSSIAPLFCSLSSLQLGFWSHNLIKNALSTDICDFMLLNLTLHPVLTKSSGRVGYPLLPNMLLSFVFLDTTVLLFSSSIAHLLFSIVGFSFFPRSLHVESL